MSFKNNVVVFVAVCLSYQIMGLQVQMTAELKAQYTKYLSECSTEHSVGAADVKEFAKTSSTDNENVKCTLACVLKKTGMTDDDGKLSAEGVRKVGALVYSDKPELMDKAEEFLKACIPVNDEEVSGKEECERAALIFKCYAEHKASEVL